MLQILHIGAADDRSRAVTAEVRPAKRNHGGRGGSEWEDDGQGRRERRARASESEVFAVLCVCGAASVSPCTVRMVHPSVTQHETT